jgi:hypothetical protein
MVSPPKQVSAARPTVVGPVLAMTREADARADVAQPLVTPRLGLTDWVRGALLITSIGGTPAHLWRVDIRPRAIADATPVIESTTQVVRAHDVAVEVRLLKAQHLVDHVLGDRCREVAAAQLREDLRQRLGGLLRHLITKFSGMSKAAVRAMLREKKEARITLNGRGQ